MFFYLATLFVLGAVCIHQHYSIQEKNKDITYLSTALVKVSSKLITTQQSLEVVKSRLVELEQDFHIGKEGNS